MNYLQGSFPVSAITPGNMFDFTINCPPIAAIAKAGQFVHIRVPGFTLRRPISICEVCKDSIRIMFDIRGEGTQALAQTKVGDNLDLMGPLGNGFDLLSDNAKAVVVGGGIGVPPLLEVAKHYSSNATAILGFRDREKIVLLEDFTEVGACVRLATDDGSAGHHGFVTDLLLKRLEEGLPDIVYACGPKVMLEAVSAICIERGVRCKVSLEERMGCGVGACLVCACRTQKSDGNETYSHVCKDGPVFEAQEVIFHD